VPRDARLINHISAGHEQGLAGSIPILAWACTSMPYHPEFGANPAAYVAAFMRNIDWDTALVQYQNAVKVKPPPPLIQKQFADLPSITVEEVKGMLDSGKAVQVIDTRPRHYTTRAHEIVRGAVWRDPERDRRTVNC
jgi:superoxide dismutase, Fe-Mn family